MKLSIVIIGYNSWHFLEKNLASLRFLGKNPEAEIIYIDNASTDGSIEKITTKYPAIQIIVNENNEGVSVARNQGLRRASGEYIWFLDSDTVVTEAALSGMIAFMEKNPDVGLCGCKMYGQDGKTQQSCREFPTIEGKLKSGIHILGKKIGLNLYATSIERGNYDTDVQKPFPVDYVIGACQLIRREAQQKVGELDEKIFYGPEDADFCRRMKMNGYQVYYLPDISIYHAYQRISSSKIFSKINWKHLCGLLYFFWKYR